MKHWDKLKIKTILYNFGYFLKEVMTMIRLNLLTNILSLVSIGLVFFILVMVISGWQISNQVVEAIKGEAEINAFFDNDINDINVVQVVENINNIDGVYSARIVHEDEAYSRMIDILGKEAHVMEFIDENPFSSFVEVKIDLNKIDDVLHKINLIEDIEYVRDNKEILDHFRNIIDALKLFGFIVVAGIGISTLVIVSHIIRQGIENNREQISTLRLLGAPESFIAVPYLLKGLILTIGGGILALVLSAFTLRLMYTQMTGPIPFIPLLPRETLMSSVVSIVMVLSSAIGIIGSLIGFSSATNS